MTYNHNEKTFGDAINMPLDQALDLSKTALSILRTTLSHEGMKSELVEFIDNQYKSLTTKEQALITYTIIATMEIEFNTIMKKKKEHITMVGYA
jgi:hypothetical protein